MGGIGFRGGDDLVGDADVDDRKVVKKAQALQGFKVEDGVGLEVQHLLALLDGRTPQALLQLRQQHFAEGQE